MRLRLCDGLKSQYSYCFAMENNVYGTESHKFAARANEENYSALSKVFNSSYEASDLGMMV